jgi:rod shape-determining protein MreC
VILSFLLIYIDKNSNHLDTLRGMGHDFMSPIYSVVDFPQKMSTRVKYGLTERLQLLKENERLADANRFLSYDAMRFNSARNENNRLRGMLQSSSGLKEEVEVANVLQIKHDPSSKVVFLDRGSNSGVFVGQPVVDAEGVVGQVINVGRFISTVLLATDRNHSIPVVIDRNGLRSIAEGSRENKTLSLLFLSSSDDVRVGDKVVSSGLGDVFPKGYPVGSVISVEPILDSEYQNIRVSPASKIGRFREVLLVMPNNFAKPSNTAIQK